MPAEDRSKTQTPPPTYRPAHEIGRGDGTTWIQPAMGRPNVTTAPVLQTAPASAPRPPLPSIEIPVEATQTAEELFKALGKLHAEGRVRIDLDIKRLMHIDSPVGIEAESNQWVYGLGVITALLWWQLGYKIGLAAMGVSLVLYLTLAKAHVRRRIDRRVRSQVLEDIVRWRKLWNFGGVALQDTGAEGQRCAAPDDNWMDFVRQRMSR